ncbi:hypothetical protein COV18_06610 [Candidatus Woesearchaeota archaeon CG10_big_fil_rev_8_21_14_0_10_37_12]|nr:MAG: hypothetical protein COV18_06610 [Candidatus Woesearchaeota archaeon CG10_big_fil_rev_8_21_14_0_10_37_12]
MKDFEGRRNTLKWLLSLPLAAIACSSSSSPPRATQSSLGKARLSIIHRQSTAADPELSIIDGSSRIHDTFSTKYPIEDDVTWHPSGAEFLYGYAHGTDVDLRRYSRNTGLDTEFHSAGVTPVRAIEYTHDGLKVLTKINTTTLNPFHRDGAGEANIFDLDPTTVSIGRYSPDDAQLAVIAEGTVYLVDVASFNQGFGRNLRTLSLPGTTQDISWHPDRSELLAAISDGSATNLYRVDPSNGNFQQLTTETTGEFRLGTTGYVHTRDDQIIARRIDGSNPRILVSLDGRVGGTYRELTRPGMDCDQQVLDRKRELLAFRMRDPLHPDTSEVHAGYANGSSIRQVSTGKPIEYSPKWI